METGADLKDIRRPPWWFGGLFLVALGGLALFMFNYLNSHAPSRSLSEKLRNHEPLRLGYASEAPFAFVGPNGEVTGAWPEVACRVLREMGITNLKWVRCEFGVLLDNLNAGNIDIDVTGMFITPERQKKALFSRPIARIGAGLLARRGNPKQLHVYADAGRNSKAVIAVLIGAVEQKAMLAAGVPAERLLVVPDAQSGLAAVKTGRADALALTSVTVRYMAANDPEQSLEAISVSDPTAGTNGLAPAGYAFRPLDREFYNQFEASLQKLMATPEYLEIIEPFGFSAENLPRK